MSAEVEPGPMRLMRSWPGAGVAAVYRWRRRSQSLRKELLWTALMSVGLLTLSAVLQQAWLSETTVAGDRIGGVLHRWLIASGIGMGLLFLPLAALLGASSIPSVAEQETVEAALLTHLSPFDMVMGRLLAAFRPLGFATALSYGFWLTAQAVWSVLPNGMADALIAISLAHLALFCALLMTGAVSALFTVGRKPGRIRGAVTGLGFSILCVSGILLVNPIVSRMNDPVRLIEGVLLVNPICAVTTSYKMDLLRSRWLYGRTEAPEFEFAYPPPQASAALFVCITLIAQGAAARRLRRIYQG